MISGQLISSAAKVYAGLPVALMMRLTGTRQVAVYGRIKQASGGVPCPMESVSGMLLLWIIRLKLKSGRIRLLVIGLMSWY